MAKHERTLDDELVQYRINLSPRASGDWHLSMVVAEYWRVEPLANLDCRVDTIDVARDAIDGWLAEQQQKRHESRSKASKTST
mgnify:CR=1 FL=1